MEIIPSSILSGLVATIITLIITTYREKKTRIRAYKMQIFTDMIAYRADLTVGQSSTGKFQAAVNQVFIAYNNNKKVITAFNKFCDSTRNNQETKTDCLVSLLKEMAKDIHIDCSFANDSLFLNLIMIK